MTETISKRGRGRPRAEEVDPLRVRRYAGKTSFSPDEVRQSLVRNYGSIAYAAEQLNKMEEARGGDRRITAEAIRHLCRQRDWLKDLQRFGTEQLADLCEHVIIQAIKNGDVETAKWWLSRRHPEFRQGRIDLMQIDPRTLADAVLLKLFDPFALDERQLAMVVERIGARLTAARQMKVIEHEPTGGS